MRGVSEMSKKVLRGLLVCVICAALTIIVVTVNEGEDPPFGQNTPGSITVNI